MEDLKIKVRKNLDELVDLFKQYGCKNFSYTCTTRNYILLEKGMLRFCGLKSNFDESKAREVSIGQLRDLVVLKRNSEGDAQLIDSFGDKWFVDSDDGYWMFERKVWRPALKPSFVLKPIEKTMKEYLDKEYLDPRNGYKLIEAPESEALELHASEWILVPEGAEVAKINPSESLNFYKQVNGVWWLLNSLTNNKWHKPEFNNESYNPFDGSLELVWQRQAQPEELPLIDNEPFLTPESVEFETMTGHQLDVTAAFMGFRKRSNGETDDVYRELVRNFGKTQSLNDQYAEIKKVREKHSHYKKDISHLNVLDIYRIDDLFKPHPCGAHIAKKALCNGQRGHKDLLTDIQDIIDTAERWKEMVIEDENRCED